jgi:hypothetical protein
MSKRALCLISQPNWGVRHELERAVVDEHMEERVVGGRNGAAQACLPRPGRLVVGKLLSLFDEIVV